MLNDKKQRLGKGLNALIPDMDLDLESESGPYREIELQRIIPNKYQPRHYFDEDALSELALSIKEHGVAQPIVVREHGDRYELVAGERRWRACKQLGLETIPAIIKPLNEDQSLQLALIENIQREDINPIEEARAYQVLIKTYSYSQEALAARLGKGRSTISNSLRLLDLPDEILQLIEQGRISSGHAKALLSVPVNEQRFQLLQRIIAEGLSVRETERAVQELLALKPLVKKKQAYQMEQLFFIQENLWQNVTFSGTPKKGKLTFSYSSEAEKNDLLTRLGIQ